MRLLVILNVYHPDRGGGGAVYTDLFRSLAARGIEVTVRAPYPFYPEWTDKSGRNGLRIWRYEEEGVSVERFGLFIPRDPRSLWQRLLYESTYCCSLLRRVHDARKFDAIMAFSPLAGGVAAAALMRAWSGTPVWLNVQDISADASAAAGITGHGLASRVLGAIERALFNCASVWSTISPVMLERLLELRRRRQPVLYLPNWVGHSLQLAISAQPPRRRRRPGDPLRLLYAGNIGQKQNLLAFCKALQCVKTPVQMRIFGSGACAGEVERWVRESGDRRFSFGSFLAEDEFASELNQCDLYAITETAGAGGSFIPSKLVSGFLAGAPVLTVCDPGSPLGREVIEADAGPQLSWSAMHSLDSILADIGAHPDRLERWERNATARVARYDRERLIDAFERGVREFAETGRVTEAAMTITDERVSKPEFLPAPGRVAVHG